MCPVYVHAALPFDVVLGSGLVGVEGRRMQSGVMDLWWGADRCSLRNEL